MTLEEYQERLQDLAQSSAIKGTQRVIVPAASGLLAAIKNRITREGKKSDDSQIGYYSTKPMYAGVEDFDKKSAFKPQGKLGGETITYNINTRKKQRTTVTNQFRPAKTMYLDEGYKELRDIQGKPTDKMNLNYRGDLVIAGYQMQAKETEVLLGLVSEREVRKKEGLEKRFGRFLYATSQELNSYKDEVIEEQQKLTIEILNGA